MAYRNIIVIAVLTGDLVDSTQLDKQAYATSLKVMETLFKQFSDAYQARYELYRGDAFQLVFTQPQFVMRCAIMLKLALHSHAELPHPVRVNLSVGLGDYKFLDDKNSRSQGEAFELSGRGLDKNSKGSLSVHCAQKRLADIFDLSTQFLDRLLGGLTVKQARVLLSYIQYDFPDQQTIADKIGTGRQNINLHLNRLGSELVYNYIQHFEQLLTESS
ncbi:MarR family transcriptional regulator [Neptunicella sp. SCSIO 80796]|uniref:MarR family transcriptional regulator n=1 Tax=Neptunicella plasticusilytica TaxID=3117012 RepID=UPI003A4DA071